ncbi:ATP-citrate synthase alpha chain protein 3 isoform X1 [Camellia sinensis]|uniref:ATP-citrate synthase alpha chain protein 3 isoform X1 n=1 Tax=Camellia sinensis TaxID=4442 RepID=UPI001035BCB9|nr:ATP-citrate synthase alpha chain protein 3 isoform X1 [Camellia sinensis]XP_028112539.1 ATP-citrate synthase alpha chain protein 3 isoform X1 [Camellia sinensis]
MARKKIREYDSKRLLKEHLMRLARIDLQICSAQIVQDVIQIYTSFMQSPRGDIEAKRRRRPSHSLPVTATQPFPSSDGDGDERSSEISKHLFSSPAYQPYLATKQLVNEATNFPELTNKEPWLSSTKLVVKPDMLFGKRGKSGLVALNLDLAQVADFVKARLGVEVEMGGCKAPITTFIVEPFVPHDQEYYLSIVSDRLGCTISFSECGGIEIEENWDKVKTISLPTEKPMTLEACAPLIATLPLEVRGKIGDFILGVFAVFQDLDFSFLEMNPFTLVNGEPYPLDMRGELDDTAAFKNFKKWGDIEFPLPFGRVLSPTESFIHSLDEKTSASLKFTVLNPKGRIWTMVAGGGASVIYADTVGDLGYASELGNYAEYSGAPNEDEVLQYARVVIDCATADPDGRKRALLIGGGIANFTDVAATFNGIIRALREKESKLKASRMHIYVRRGGPNYQTGLAKMRALGEELGVPLEVYGPEATMTGICKQAIDCIMSAA